MKLTNDQIYVLGSAGIGKLNYASLEAEDALSAYKLRRGVMRHYEDINTQRNEIMRGVYGDRLQAAMEYETKGTGMEPKEYNGLLSKAMKMLADVGAEAVEIDTKPIAFASWLQLLKDNAFLAGSEEILEEFISD